MDGEYDYAYGPDENNYDHVILEEDDLTNGRGNGQNEALLMVEIQYHGVEGVAIDSDDVNYVNIATGVETSIGVDNENRLNEEASNGRIEHITVISNIYYE